MMPCIQPMHGKFLVKEGKHIIAKQKSKRKYAKELFSLDVMTGVTFIVLYDFLYFL